MQKTNKKKILLIEDDPFLTEIYVRKCEESGFEIKMAEKAERGWRLLQGGDFDLLLLDIVLPGMDGWELLKKIKKQEQWADLKVVILSNLGQKDEVEKGLKLGVDNYLIKAHYTPGEVVEEIKGILE